MRHFAVIGTRDITEAQKEWVRGVLLAEMVTREDDGIHESGGCGILHTGAAPGVDQFAAEQWLDYGGSVHLHLPWTTYEHEWVDSIARGGAHHFLTINDRPPDIHSSVCMDVAMHHDRWDTLKQGVQKLHLRNHAIVAPCSKIYACPGTAPWGGGTAMGIKLARHYKIECDVFDPILQRDWSDCGCGKGE